MSVIIDVLCSPICLNWTADTKVIPAPRPASTREPPIRRLREAEEAAHTRACSILTSDNTDVTRQPLWQLSADLCFVCPVLQNAE